MNKQDIKKLAKDKGLDVVEETMKINESGLDFLVSHAKDEEGVKWILRIPRRPDSMAKANQEKYVLDAVNGNTHIQAPDWSIFTNELIAYKQLDGVPAGTVDPEIQNYVWSFDFESSPAAYHQSLGRLLAQLHQVPTSYVKGAGIAMYNSDEARKSMKSRMENVKDTYGVNQELWNRWQAWISNDALWPKHTGLSHGDVHPGHILINTGCEVTGLIDWTEVAVTDVSRDFTAHYLVFGEAGLEKVIDAYENAGGKTWSHMKEHIIELHAAGAIVVAEFAQSSGLKEMEDMAKQMLGVSDHQ
ncbi:macrolide phosphotransferase [Geomicrobium halophilum]|uniref:Macrolide phosphotransferase n=1 Tax=Geomicrobium halophilum TaxID=549000 RepID=A0A841PWY5_9BACL|nr:macrolide 2'-phosphotransferase [Geomicrobium halophilum]MBB6451081.1 macrolide phosphotransferase [Geomicrobium halophilum]